MWIECNKSYAFVPTSYHYSDIIMGAMASQITSLTIVYSTVYSGVDQRKHQSSASLASVRGIHRWPVNSPHKGPVTLKIFPFDDVIMSWVNGYYDAFACMACIKLTNRRYLTKKLKWKYNHSLKSMHAVNVLDVCVSVSLCLTGNASNSFSWRLAFLFYLRQFMT